MVITVASHNAGKIRELRELLPGLTLVPMREAGFAEEIAETGTSYEENALIKARGVHEVVGGAVLADDSGLSLDVLEGAPGLHSARLAGETASDADRIETLWRWLAPYDPKDWQACFVAVLCLILPDGSVHFFRGEMKGRILPERRGQHGFGYDPVFYLPDYGKTTAELPTSEKNRLSHRGQAAAGLLTFLQERKES